MEDDKIQDSSKNLVPESVILKVFDVLGIKQPKESCIFVQNIVEKVMDNFVEKLKTMNKKQKINEDDIKDLITRDDIEYLKEVLKNNTEEQKD